MRLTSKLGKILLIIYFILLALLIYLTLQYKGWFGGPGLGIWIGSFPWGYGLYALIDGTVLEKNFGGTALVLGYILNFASVYFLGFGLGKIYGKFKKNS